LDNKGKYRTIGLIGSGEINSIRPDSLLIHASRGGVVEEAALLKRLSSKDIFAAIDVWENEPHFNAELAKNCLIASPHVAGYSREGKIRGAMAMARLIHEHTGISPDYSEMGLEMSKYMPIDISTIGLTQLSTALRQSRQLDSDTERMLEIAELNDIERAIAFDALRKNYPTRHEIL
jgi:erythronate-4-phosphate dehydrogenase